MTMTIERYLDSLPEDILAINVSNKNIKSLPDLSRFKNLKQLYCSDNELTSLPNLPQNLETLSCSDNKLTSLPTLPQNLEVLHCYSNKLTSLPNLPQNLKQLSCSNNELTSFPTLPQSLKTLFCYNNKLTSLPTLPQNLESLYCSKNELTSLPTLPQNLKKISYSNNFIYEIVTSDTLFQINNNIKILNNFRDLYYCLKFKKQLRKWLWEKVREPNAMRQYGPNYLIENLGDDDDLDEVLDNWN
jgi:Leucine-rich repeat (LRR) protein